MSSLKLDDADLYVALANLTPHQREIVWERYWRGLTPNEIAAERGCTRQAVHAILAKAKKTLMESLS